jgi:hypothetical protein
VKLIAVLNIRFLMNNGTERMNDPDKEWLTKNLPDDLLDVGDEIVMPLPSFVTRS